MSLALTVFALQGCLSGARSNGAADEKRLENDGDEAGKQADANDDLGQEGGSAIEPGDDALKVQNFGNYRDLIDADIIPGPATLNPHTFFLNYPLTRHPGTPNECDQPLCLRATVASGFDQFSDRQRTFVTLGLAARRESEELPRQAMHWLFVLDVSRSMDGAPIEALRDSLRWMTQRLRHEDRVSLISFSDQAQALALAAEPNAPILQSAIAGLQAEGQSNLYDGLRTSYEHAENPPLGTESLVPRVVLIADGPATTGIVDDPALEGLANAYAALGISLSTLGLGHSTDVELMRNLAEHGSGRFHLADRVDLLPSLLTEELDTTDHRIASEATFNLGLDSELNYHIGSLFGTGLAILREQRALITWPSTLLSETATGVRQIGHGSIIIEVQNDDVQLTRDRAPRQNRVQLGDLSLKYEDFVSKQRHTQDSELELPFLPHQNVGQEYFSEPAARLSLLVIQSFEGLVRITSAAQRGDRLYALHHGELLREHLQLWSEELGSGAILDELGYLEQLLKLIEQQGSKSD